MFITKVLVQSPEIAPSEPTKVACPSSLRSLRNAQLDAGTGKGPRSPKPMGGSILSYIMINKGYSIWFNTIYMFTNTKVSKSMLWYNDMLWYDVIFKSVLYSRIVWLNGLAITLFNLYFRKHPCYPCSRYVITIPGLLVGKYQTLIIRCQKASFFGSIKIGI